MSDDSFLTQYYANLSADKDVAMNYLHQTVNWQVTIFIGGMIAVLSQPKFPDIFSVAVLCVISTSTSHFAIRSAKAYLNLVRWSLIERRYLRYITEQSGGGRNNASILSAIETYHTSWSCPLKRRTILYKVLFELGFGFQIATLIAILLFSALRVAVSKTMPVFLLAGVGIAGEVWFGFLTSPYFRNVVPDAEASNLR